MINLKVEVDTMEREIKRLQARISTMTVQGSMAMKPTRGNCRRGKENNDDNEKVDDTPLPKRKRNRKGKK